MTDERQYQVINLLEDLLFEVKRDKELYIDEIEAGRRLNLSPSYMAALRQTQKGPKYVKEGSRVLYAPEDLKAWADSRIRLGGTHEA